jgi:hypothetical protein
LAGYGEEFDYRDGRDLPPELQMVGRVWFAADPMERIAVHFDDLPTDTAHALGDTV